MSGTKPDFFGNWSGTFSPRNIGQHNIVPEQREDLTVKQVFEGIRTPEELPEDVHRVPEHEAREPEDVEVVEIVDAVVMVMPVEVMTTVEVGLVMAGTRTGGPVALLESLVSELVVELALLFYNSME